MLHRPDISEEIIKQINSILHDHPQWHRTQISRHLCELWEWRMPNGQLKDISCRDMLRALDKAGWITLPKPRSVGHKAGNKSCIQQMLHDTTPINAALRELTPLRLVWAQDREQLTAFKSYIDQYHYLGFDRTVGENMKYMVYSATGDFLACLLFGSAAWSCKDRDTFIGWSSEARKKNLQCMTDNTRFLIAPWVKTPHLASHILSLAARRLSADWERKYGHPIYCLETFVECGRFKGTCYKAANWVCAGQTVGRGRDDRDKTAALPLKWIYLYPLHKQYKQLLRQLSE